MRVIAGTARSLHLMTVPSMRTRPTTDRIKETLFNMLQSRISQSVFLDLFSGSGAIGIEALSRGAAKAIFVENENDALGCIRDNLCFTSLEQRAVVVRGDACVQAQHLTEQYRPTIIFMDPPYDQELEKQILASLTDCAGLTHDTLIIVEASLETDFSYLSDLGYQVEKQKQYKTNQHVFIRRN